MKTEKMELDKEAFVLDTRYKFIDVQRNIIFADIVKCVKERRMVPKELIDTLHALYEREENLGRAEND